jgi:comEA protein
MFRRLSDWLALTSTERKVILFLAGTLLLGAGIRLYQETFPSVPQFDYRASDSTFAALSESNSEESTAEDDTSAPSIVNINTASKEELMALPGIGAVVAGRIIAYRDTAGRFETVEDLRSVKGIGARKFEQLRPLITAQ